MDKEADNLSSGREMKPKNVIIDELCKIPAIGKAGAEDLWIIGVRKISDLRDKNPYVLYERLNSHSGRINDICVLYMLRCAVYFATETRHDRRKLTWWYWKNKRYNEKGNPESIKKGNRRYDRE